MKSDSVIRNEGMNLLIDSLGKVDAERFISLIIREPFDYTKWQTKLFQGKSIRDLSKEAMQSINRN